MSLYCICWFGHSSSKSLLAAHCLSMTWVRAVCLSCYATMYSSSCILPANSSQTSLWHTLPTEKGLSDIQGNFFIILIIQDYFQCIKNTLTLSMIKCDFIWTLKAPCASFIERLPLSVSALGNPHRLNLNHKSVDIWSCLLFWQVKHTGTMSVVKNVTGMFKFY